MNMDDLFSKESKLYKRDIFLQKKKDIQRRIHWVFSRMLEKNPLKMYTSKHNIYISSNPDVLEYDSKKLCHLTEFDSR